MFKHLQSKSKLIPWPHAASALACAAGIAGGAVRANWPDVSTSLKLAPDAVVYRFANPAEVHNSGRLKPFSHSMEMYGGMGWTKDSELWRALLTSPHMARPQSPHVRALDMVEQTHLLFNSPLGGQCVWRKSCAAPELEAAFCDAGDADAAHSARYLVDGDLAGADVFEDPRTIAMDGDATYWLCEDGTLRLYRRDGSEETAYSPMTWTRFADGPFAGELLADKARHIIGAEDGVLRFLENDADVVAYTVTKSVARHKDTVAWRFSAAPFAGLSLGEIIDGAAPGYAYLGWDGVGPVFASFTLAGGAVLNAAGLGEITIAPGPRGDFPPTHHTGIVRIPEGGRAFDARGNALAGLAGSELPSGALVTPDGHIIIQPDGASSEIGAAGVVALAPGAVVVKASPDGAREKIAFPNGGVYDPTVDGGLMREPVRDVSLHFYDGAAYKRHAQYWSMYAARKRFAQCLHTRDSQIWTALLASGDALVGPAAAPVRGRDFVERDRIYLRGIDDRLHASFYAGGHADEYPIMPGDSADAAANTRFMRDGPQKGGDIYDSSALLAIGDRLTLWLDPDGSPSIYGRATGALVMDPAWTRLGSTGPLAGLPLRDALRHFIGFEDGALIFMPNDTDICAYRVSNGREHADARYNRIWRFPSSSPLHGAALGEIIDGKIPGYTYLGWGSSGPAILGIPPADEEAVAEKPSVIRKESEAIEKSSKAETPSDKKPRA